MRILIIGMNYLPESASIGPYTAGLANHLLGRGHDLRVVTSFPHLPQWRIWNEYRGRWYRREVIRGITVRRTYVHIPNEPRKTINRILYDLSFSVSALIGSLAGGRCDVVLAVSPPLQAGLTGWIVSRLMRIPLFFHIQDLVPDMAIATGLMSPDSFAIRVAQKLENFVYRRATRIGVICAGFQANLERKGVPREKIRLLSNSIDLSSMPVCNRDNAFRRQNGLSTDDFVVMYSGSIALKQGLQVLIETAALLRNQPGLRFVIVGEGLPLAGLKQRADELKLANVIFLPFQPRETLPEQLAAADVLVITQKQAITDIVFPGKLLYYMAAARPIIAAVSADSETGRFVTAHQVGIVTPPEDATAMANAIRTLLTQDTLAIGRRGRAVVERDFDEKVVLPAFAEALESLGPMGNAAQAHGRLP